MAADSCRPKKPCIYWGDIGATWQILLNNPNQQQCRLKPLIIANIFEVGFSVGKTAASVLEIKEFVPGRPWGSQHPSADAVASVPPATTTGAANQGLGVRRSSLADMEKLVATSSSRLSTSEWSLDGNPGESAANGGSKGIVDPAGSLPALWTPLETSAGTAVPSSKGRSSSKHLTSLGLVLAASLTFN